MKIDNNVTDQQDHFFRTFHSSMFLFRLLAISVSLIVASHIYYGASITSLSALQANFISVLGAFVTFAAFEKLREILHTNNDKSTHKDADVSNMLYTAEISLKDHIADIIGRCEILAQHTDTKENEKHIAAILNATTKIDTLAENQIHIFDLDYNDGKAHHNMIAQPQSELSQSIEEILDRAQTYAVWNNISMERQTDYNFGKVSDLDISSLKILLQNILQNVITTYNDVNMHVNLAPIEILGERRAIQMRIKLNAQDDAIEIRKLFEADKQVSMNAYVTKRLISHLNADLSFIGNNTLELRIPYRDETTDITQAGETHVNSAKTKRPKNTPITTTPSILIVDDHPANVMLLHKFASKFRHARIDEAISGAEAVQIYNMHSHELIFMDCQMPGMDGLQACKKIREIEAIYKTEPAIIIGVTADTSRTTRRKCVDAGMNSLLYKPITTSLVQEAVGIYFSADIITPEGAGNPNKKNQYNSHEKNHALANAEDTLALMNENGIEHLPVNLARLRSYTEGDLEEEKMFFNIFIEQARQTLDTLEQTLQDHNLEDWCRAAHKLKGSSANIGAEQLAELCQIAEFHDKTITEEDILKAIRTELNKVDEFLNTLTDKAVKAHLSDESKRMH